MPGWWTPSAGAVVALVLVHAGTGCSSAPVPEIAPAPFGTQRSDFDADEAPAHAGRATPVADAVDAARGAPAPGSQQGQAEPAEPTREPPAEAGLRERLAEDPDPTLAALELAGELCAGERHAEALAVVQQALSRTADPRLRVARVGLLRDLGRRHLAVAELASLRSEHGVEALHPSLVFELAELQWLEGDPAAARASLAELSRVHAEDPWLAAHQADLQALEAEMTIHRAPPRVRVRDLLGNLRGAPDPAVRMRTLEWLAGDRNPPGGAAREPSRDERQERLRAQATAIACGDDSAAVRARAMQLATPDAVVRRDFCAAGLDDADALVRTVAASRSVELLQAEAVPLLLARLVREDEPAAFRALHAALAQVVADPPRCGPDDADSAAGRAALTALWRRRCAP